MSYYRTCPYCGCNLDPGEVCDCRERKTAVSATNTNGGKVEKGLPTSFSTSNFTRNEWSVQV